MYYVIRSKNEVLSAKAAERSELGISNDLVYFICRSSAEIITLSAARQLR
jgi:hypothetical protein